MPLSSKIAAEPQAPSGGSIDEASGSESPYAGSSLGLPGARQQAMGAAAAGASPVAILAEQTPADSGGGPGAASKGSQEAVSTATAERKRQPQGTLGTGTPSTERGEVEATAAGARAKTAESAAGAERRGAGQGPGRVMAASSRAKISETASSLATPPAFPGTLGVDPRLPEGAGSRAMLQAQEGHVRPSEFVPSAPAGTQKAGMADASGAEGPEDEQGVGPFGGGGAHYAASLGLSTPEPMRVDDRGRADLSGYRGKSNGAAHELAKAYIDTKYANSKAQSAASEAGLHEQDARAKEKENQEQFNKDKNAEEFRERDKERQELDAKAAQKRAEAAYWQQEAEEAEKRHKQADEKVERSGDKDKIRAQARQDVPRRERRQGRADARRKAAEARAAQRLRRKGGAWRRNRRHQVNERQQARDRRRERRLQRRLPEESMKRWSAAQKEIEGLRGRIEEIDNELDDPRTPPGKREELEEEKKAKENELKGHLLDQYWEEHGGFPCGEIDCCDPNYAKCRPECPPEQTCICDKSKDCDKKDKEGDEKKDRKKESDEGKDKDKGPITQGGAAGKHADKEAQPPGVEPGPDQGGGGGPPPGVESPDDGYDDAEDIEERPDDGRQGKKRPPKGAKGAKGLGGGGGDLPLVFGKGDQEYEIYQGEDGRWYVKAPDGSVFRLKTAPELLREEDGKKYYDLAGVEREPDRINFLGPILQSAAETVQGILGERTVETLRLVAKQYVDESVLHLVERYAREGTVDLKDAAWLLAEVAIPGSLPGGGNPFKRKPKTRAAAPRPKPDRPPARPPGGGGPGKPPGEKPAGRGGSPEAPDGTGRGDYTGPRAVKVRSRKIGELFTNEERALVQSAVEGDVPLSEIPKSLRKAYAEALRNQELTGSARAIAEGSLYNEARAQFLEGRRGPLGRRPEFLDSLRTGNR
jgi:hypothetical protein